MKKEEYEEEFLVHAIIQVLIYSLALSLDSLSLQLRVLVFFSKTHEAVLYETDIHKDQNLVNKLFKKLKGKHATNKAIKNINENKIPKNESRARQNPSDQMNNTVVSRIRRKEKGKQRLNVQFVEPNPEESTEDEEVIHALESVRLR